MDTVYVAPKLYVDSTYAGGFSRPVIEVTKVIGGLGIGLLIGTLAVTSGVIGTSLIFSAVPTVPVCAAIGLAAGAVLGFPKPEKFIHFSDEVETILKKFPFKSYDRGRQSCEVTDSEGVYKDFDLIRRGDVEIEFCLERFGGSHNYLSFIISRRGHVNPVGNADCPKNESDFIQLITRLTPIQRLGIGSATKRGRS